MSVVEKPMLFSGPMVRAILAGRKTQTRRIVKPQPTTNIPGGGWYWKGGVALRRAGYGEDYVHTDLVAVERAIRKTAPHLVGCQIWVKETWGPCDGGVCYRASEKPTVKPDGGKWRPSIFMPRWASRITLKVSEVRVGRLHDITISDAISEGLKSVTKDHGTTWKWGIPDRDGWPGTDDDGWAWSEWELDPRKAYAKLWDRINGKGAWDRNPWVWVYEFPKQNP